MTTFTTDQAKSFLCPLSRTFGTKDLYATCRADACAAWRWVPIAANDPRVKSAITAEITRLGGGHLRHKEAMQNIMADKAAHGIPTPDHGYCGIGGKPET